MLFVCLFKQRGECATAQAIVLHQTWRNQNPKLAANRELPNTSSAPPPSLLTPPPPLPSVSPPQLSPTRCRHSLPPTPPPPAPHPFSPQLNFTCASPISILVLIGVAVCTGLTRNVFSDVVRLHPPHFARAFVAMTVLQVKAILDGISALVCNNPQGAQAIQDMKVLHFLNDMTAPSSIVLNAARHALL